jgi:hypothetical protein
MIRAPAWRPPYLEAPKAGNAEDAEEKTEDTEEEGNPGQERLR